MINTELFSEFASAKSSGRLDSSINFSDYVKLKNKDYREIDQLMQQGHSKKNALNYVIENRKIKNSGKGFRLAADAVGTTAGALAGRHIGGQIGNWNNIAGIKQAAVDAAKEKLSATPTAAAIEKVNEIARGTAGLRDSVIPMYDYQTNTLNPSELLMTRIAKAKELAPSLSDSALEAKRKVMERAGEASNLVDTGNLLSRTGNWVNNRAEDLGEGLQNVGGGVAKWFRPNANHTDKVVNALRDQGHDKSVAKTIADTVINDDSLRTNTTKTLTAAGLQQNALNQAAKDSLTDKIADQASHAELNEQIGGAVNKWNESADSLKDKTVDWLSARNAKVGEIAEKSLNNENLGTVLGGAAGLVGTDLAFQGAKKLWDMNKANKIKNQFLRPQH